MTDKPCTHCGGTGTEPDALSAAYAILIDRIDDAGIIDALKDSLRIGVHCLYEIATGQIEDRDARIVFLEAALRDILSRFPPSEVGTTTQPRPCTWHDVANWRAVLENRPGEQAADGSCKQHDFKPAPEDPELGHLGVQRCIRCGSRCLPARGERKWTPDHELGGRQ